MRKPPAAEDEQEAKQSIDNKHPGGSPRSKDKNKVYYDTAEPPDEQNPTDDFLHRYPSPQDKSNRSLISSNIPLKMLSERYNDSESLSDKNISGRTPSPPANFLA